MRDVSMMPTQIAFTRMPWGATSRAIAAVSAWSPALLAAYAAALPGSSFPATDEMLVIEPPSPCSMR